jgi:hypothetical protein
VESRAAEGRRTRPCSAQQGLCAYTQGCAKPQQPSPPALACLARAAPGPCALAARTRAPLTARALPPVTSLPRHLLLPQFWLELADFHGASGRPDEAAEALAKAQAALPGCLQLRLLAADLAERTGKPAEVRAPFRGRDGGGGDSELGRTTHAASVAPRLHAKARVRSSACRRGCALSYIRTCAVRCARQAVALYEGLALNLEAQQAAARGQPPPPEEGPLLPLTAEQARVVAS